jgi:hypothetical protein
MSETKAPHIWIPGVDDFKEHLQREYGDAEHVAKPDGVIFVNGQEVASTLMCCHCGTHYIPRKGSGIRRGFCLKCMQVTCGNPLCVECKPIAREYGL